MAKLLVSDRVIFRNKGDQKQFVISCKDKINLNWKNLSDFLGVNQRTLSDWKSEKFNMSYRSAELLSSKSGVKIPNNTEVQSWKSHLSDISKQGGVNRYKKYGKVCLNDDKRKDSWKKWWKESGQFQERKKIVDKPDFSKKLAEFVGIMLGDGGISEYQITVTLNSERDKEYIKFVTTLIKDLFGVHPGIYKIREALAIKIVVHRKDLVSFCESIGLKKGNKLKQNLDIPQWIKDNKEYQKACLRGLVDTDGCFFKHRYISKNKEYSYLKIAFTSASEELLNSALDIVQNFGINGRINYSGRDLRIENGIDVKRYIKTIGTSNPKNKVLIDSFLK